MISQGWLPFLSWHILSSTSSWICPFVELVSRNGTHPWGNSFAYLGDPETGCSSVSSSSSPSLSSPLSYNSNMYADPQILTTQKGYITNSWSKQQFLHIKGANRISTNLSLKNLPVCSQKCVQKVVPTGKLSFLPPVQNPLAIYPQWCQQASEILANSEKKGINEYCEIQQTSVFSSNWALLDFFFFALPDASPEAPTSSSPSSVPSPASSSATSSGEGLSVFLWAAAMSSG